ncbi:protein translocase subunit SecD [Ammoniphilus oxalaticus]|uniref:protein translocase subunit SecD n=1 Tax=Ammoniphilus oxalaticus TaxID=66863 RepID=UPI0014759747|nr:protein translocase subunit SecD [Ammoniphilus oxalaticus]
MIKWNRIVAFLAVVGITFALIGTTAKGVIGGITLGLDLQGGFETLYEVKPIEEGQELTKNTMKDTVGAILKRIDILGVAEPEIAIEGSDRIRVKLAGVTNQEEARKLLGEPARLAFLGPNGEELMTGNDLAKDGASVQYDELHRPFISLKLANAQKFEDITREYLHQRISIALDEQILTSPEVQSVISGGNASITGEYTVEEATQLANILNAGALPVEMTEIYSNSVGAKLGAESLDKAIFAGIIGVGAIFLFMFLFYRWAGIIAIVTLVAYMYTILVVLNWMHATLTLPGIAAFILTVGMAVDANIITYERIKEELRAGKSLTSAVRAGQRRSLSTILDANITTMIAGAVLFYFGTSSIQGFAVTLMVGIVMTMLTAVLGTRLLLSIWVRSNALRKPWFYGVKESEINEL